MKKFLPSLYTAALVLGLTLATSPFGTAAVVYDGSPYTAWQSDYTGNEAHTLALWKFNNPTPSADFAGVTTAHPLTFSSNGTETGVGGKFGEALKITGNVSANDDYAGVGNSTTLFNSLAMSVEFWFQPLVDNPAAGHFFDKNRGGSTDFSGMKLQLTGSGKLLFTVGDGDEVQTLTSTDALGLEAGTWYHLAATYEAVDGVDTIKLFMNGTLIGSRVLPNSFGTLDAGIRSWRIGNRLTSTYSSMGGYYDNFRISDVAYDYSAIPEPSTVALLGVLVPLAWGMRRAALRRN